MPTSAALLRQQSFIDGRTDFSAGNSRQFSLREFVAAEAAPAPAHSYVFHLAFGGSTLLSRLLDVPGRSLVLREPNCLAQLANQKAAAGQTTDSLAKFEAVLISIRNHLGRPWADGERMVVKPSNWANNLLPDLVSNDGAQATLFLVSRRDAFVRSVIRGGTERIAFTARAAVHLSSVGFGAARWVASALTSETSPQDQLIRLACVVHAIQLNMFHSACKSNGWGSDRWLDREELSSDPVAATRHAAKALYLDLPGKFIEANVSRWMGVDAKDPRRSYSRVEQDSRDAWLAIEHGDIVDRAFDWADQIIGPDRSAAPS